MTEIQKERNRQWVEALRSNEKKAIGKMRSNDGGRCCLAVAEDVAVENGLELPSRGLALPPVEIGDYYGWDCINPTICGHLASRHNDDLGKIKGKSHKEIADLVVEEFNL